MVVVGTGRQRYSKLVQGRDQWQILVEEIELARSLSSHVVLGMIRLSRLLILMGFLLVVNVFTILLLNQGQRGT